MKIIWAVFYLNITNMFRNLKSSGIMFILPIVFIGVFALAFGDSTGEIMFKAGVYTAPEVKDIAPDVVEVIKTIDKESDTVVAEAKNYENAEAVKDAVDADEIDIAIVIGKAEAAEMPFTVTLYSKSPGSESYLIQNIIKETVFPQLAAENSLVSTKYLKEFSDETSIFALMVPGLITYGLLILIPGIAQTFSLITEKQYIFRYANSEARSFHIIIGTVLYYLLISAVQVVLLFTTATMFGFRSEGSLLTAIVPALLTSLFIIGFSLMIGAYVKKSEAATNIGTISSIIFGFFSGSFIVGIGNILKFDIFGRTFQFNDFLPSKWGNDALVDIMLYNKGLSDITTELIILAVSGVLVLLLGIITYQKKQLNAQ